MEPLLRAHRVNAVFIPYRKGAHGYEFYLQKRDEQASANPNVFSYFGGGVEEGEEIREALDRELMEELEYKPRNPQYLCRVETWRGVYHVFIEEVEPGFESEVTVHEGEYGKFLRPEEVEHLLLIRSVS